MQDQLEFSFIPFADVEPNARFVQSKHKFAWQPIGAGHVWIQDVEIEVRPDQKVKAKIAWRLTNTPNRGGAPQVTGEVSSPGWTDDEIGEHFSGRAHKALTAAEWETYKFVALSAISLRFVRPVPKRLYVHLTPKDYAQAEASGLLGKGMPSAKCILLPPYAEGRIWATPYTLEQLRNPALGWRIRRFLTGIDPSKLAQMEHTIVIEGQAARSFAIAFGPRFSLEPLGSLKGLGPQFYYRGQLRYVAGQAISRVDKSLSLSFANAPLRHLLLRAGELDRLVVYGSVPGGMVYYIYVLRSASDE